MYMTLVSIIFLAAMGTVADKTGAETEVRHISGKELSATLKKGMTPEATYSQVVISRRSDTQVYITARDKSGQSEVHAGWNDNIFIQDGQASFIVGGTATDAKEREPGEMRGSVIEGGKTIVMQKGDYLFVPAGTPHQMVLKRGQRVTFIAFKSKK